MSPNKEKPHVLVLPEDDANTRLATGFHLVVDSTKSRQMQVLPAAGGWNEVLQRFANDEVGGMDKWPKRFMVLLIDFDGREDRLHTVKAEIPARLAEESSSWARWPNRKPSRPISAVARPSGQRLRMIAAMGLMTPGATRFYATI
jgi:hypothetical protein